MKKKDFNDKIKNIIIDKFLKYFFLFFIFGSIVIFFPNPRAQTDGIELDEYYDVIPFLFIMSLFLASFFTIAKLINDKRKK